MKRWAIGCTAVLLVAALGAAMLARPFVSAGPVRHGYPLESADPGDAQIDTRVEAIVREFAADAVVVLRDERVLVESGDTHALSNVASIRKSLVSALFGIAANRGLINLDATLEELGIDEPAAPLTATERSATVRHLLEARSGVYRRSIGESPNMAASRPARGSHAPGTFFYYNNWDFNVLGTIFEQETGLALGTAFAEWIATPTGMVDFEPGHVLYETSDTTAHRIYRFFVSAADLARFGALYANGGRWREQQVVPAAWVTESLQHHSTVENEGPFDGYGYLWWLDDDTGTAWAMGSGGQFVVVDPARALSVVVRNDTGRSPLSYVAYRVFGRNAPYTEAAAVYDALIERFPGN